MFVFQVVPVSLHSTLGPTQHTFLPPAQLSRKNSEDNVFSPLSLQASQLPQICTFPPFIVVDAFEDIIWDPEVGQWLVNQGHLSVGKKVILNVLGTKA